MRKLASVQRIVDVQPIVGADNILRARVLGWDCIVGKNENYKIGDLVVYFEIDSQLDNNNPKFAFMEKKKYKVKTYKLTKFNIIGQGLVMPLSILDGLDVELKEDTDVTSVLKVTQIDTYEPDENSEASKKHSKLHKFMLRFKFYRDIQVLLKNKKKGWPGNVPHTDEIRIQAMYGHLKPLLADPGRKWDCTVKVDGQSGTFYYEKGLFRPYIGMYSRTLRKPFDGNSNWAKVEQNYKIRQVLKKINRNCFIQGEVCGPKIQGNKDKFISLKFFVFNVYFFDEKRYLNLEELGVFCDKYGLECVPPVFSKQSLADKTLEDLVSMSNGPSYFNSEALREGIVIRETENLGLDRVSFKIVSPEFLVKYGL